MTDFVCDYVRLREVARSIELPPQLFVKRKVDVNLLISRTVEWTNSGAGNSTRGAHLIREEHQCWFSILTAILPKDIGPNVFCFPQHDCDKLFQLVLFGSLRP